MVIRRLVSVFCAVMVTFGLFWGMNYLIESGDDQAQQAVKGHQVEIGQVREVTETTPDIKPPEKPIADPAPPEAPAPPTTIKEGSTNIEIGITAPLTDGGGTHVASTGIGASDGDYLPIVKVAPTYPRRAAEKGIEGYVVLEFTVTKMGAVENIRVEESTSSLFNSSAIKAAAKFKYKPKVMDGQPVDVAGVLHKLKFELQK